MCNSLMCSVQEALKRQGGIVVSVRNGEKPFSNIAPLGIFQVFENGAVQSPFARNEKINWKERTYLKFRIIKVHEVEVDGWSERGRQFQKKGFVKFIEVRDELGRTRSALVTTPPEHKKLKGRFRSTPRMSPRGLGGP